MGDLLKQLDLRALTWRALLLCGALPGLLLFGATDYLFASLGTFLSDLAEPTKYWSRHSGEVVALVVLSVSFAALRRPIFDFYRTIPIPGLRDFLLRWHSDTRYNTKLDEDKTLWNINVARWFEHGFSPQVAIEEAVRKSIRLPDETEVQDACLRSRTELSDSRFFWALQTYNLSRALNWLCCMAATRVLVAECASSIAAASPGNTAADNWSAAERQLGFSAPGDWVITELDEWRRLYAGSARAKTRIEALNNYRLTDRATRAYQKVKNYPRAQWIEATKLGNCLAALEDYTSLRYGVDASLLWSRIEKVIPKDQREEVAGCHISVQSLLNCSAACALASIAALLDARLHLRPATLPAISPDTHLLLFVGAAFFAWVFHRFSNYAAGELRLQIESRIDLYIPRWLAAVGLVPKDMDERKRMVQAAGAFAAGSPEQIPNFSLQAITDPVLVFDKAK